VGENLPDERRALKHGDHLHRAPATRMWLEKGVQWICLNADFVNMHIHSKMVLDAVRNAELAEAPKSKKA
jgi:hypothetical protein